VWRGEVTLAELSRKLGIARSLLQRWKRLLPEGPEAANAAVARVMPAMELRADEYVRELQLLVGKQALELELLRSELSAVRPGQRSIGTLKR
jgi:transposase-like protein